MNGKSTVFEKTYRDYLAQISRIKLKSTEERLGIRVVDQAAEVPLYNDPYRVSKAGIVDQSGQRPAFDVCVILCKYLLLCPSGMPTESEWVTYRGLKDGGPLTTYFLNDVERPIAREYSKRLEVLARVAKPLGGYRPKIELSCDLSLQFDALPRVPVLMVYNDADDEFPATCSVLFEKRAEHYLDAECLAILGRLLHTKLKEKAGSPSPR
jgi:hypothetical protein